MINMTAIEKSWLVVAPILKKPTTEKEAARLYEMQDYLIDYTGGDENHQLAGFLGLIGERIEEFEDEHLSFPPSTPAQIIRFLMDQHSLKQSDLAEIGNQSVVSMVLNGKRKLNARQITGLAKRFKVPADLFIEN